MEEVIAIQEAVTNIIKEQIESKSQPGLSLFAAIFCCNKYHQRTNRKQITTMLTGGRMAIGL